MNVQGTVKDAVGEKPLEGVRISLSIGERELAELFSDAEGNFTHGEAEDYTGKTLLCKVEKDGYITDEVTYQIEKDEFRLDIELKPKDKVKPPVKPSVVPDVPPIIVKPKKPWLKVAIGVGVVLVLAVAARMCIFPSKPVIHSFASNKPEMNRGEWAMLEWRTSDATQITIEPDIGDVKAAGSRKVQPNQTTTYKLTAKGKGGEVSKVTRIEVIELDTNRFGSDYKSFDLSAADYRLCRDECNRDRRCKAWTFVKPNIQGPKAKCWLKDAVPPQTMNPFCISGMK